MLGGKFRDAIRLYADTTSSPDGEEMGRRLKARRERGYTFLKMDVGVQLLRGMEDGVSSPWNAPGEGGRRGRGPNPALAHPFTGVRLTDRGLKRMQEYVMSVREVLGWDIPLAADHFGHFGVEDAIKLARALDPCNLAWLEDMIPWFYTDDYVRLKNSCETPILTGEDIYLKEEFIKLFERRAISICHPDMMSSGGLLETKKIGDTAMEHGIAMAMHFAGSPIGLFGSIHCAAATENFMVLEFHDADTEGYDDLVDGVPKPFMGRDGHVAVPDRPGLGVELNEEAIKALLRRRVVGASIVITSHPRTNGIRNDRMIACGAGWHRRWERPQGSANGSQRRRSSMRTGELVDVTWRMAATPDPTVDREPESDSIPLMRVTIEPYQWTTLARRTIGEFLRLARLGAALLISALVLGCSGAVTEATTPSDMTAETVTQITAVDPAGQRLC